MGLGFDGEMGLWREVQREEWIYGFMERRFYGLKGLCINSHQHTSSGGWAAFAVLDLQDTKEMPYLLQCTKCHFHFDETRREWIERWIELNPSLPLVCFPCSSAAKSIGVPFTASLVETTYPKIQLRCVGCAAAPNTEALAQIAQLEKDGGPPITSFRCLECNQKAIQAHQASTPATVGAMTQMNCKDCGWEGLFFLPEEYFLTLGALLKHFKDVHGLDIPAVTMTRLQ